MADSSTSLAGIVYYAREKYYQHIQNEVLELVKKYGADPILSYWKAYSLVMSGRLLEGMRELERIVDKQEVILCAPMLLAHAHKQCETVDRQAIQKLDAKVRTERTSCGEKALYNAGTFLWLCGRHDKAREYVDRMLKMCPGSSEGMSLRGWIDLTSGREPLIKRSIKYFEESLSSDQPKLAEALFGKSKFYLNRYNFSHSLDVLNQAVAIHEGFLPALIEKMKVQLALQDWDQAVETAQRCLAEDLNCIEALRMLTLHLLAREGRYDEAADRIGELIQLIDRFEPNNHALYYDTSLAFARMCGGKELILQQTMTLVQRALSLSPANAEYLTELAYQLFLSKQNKEALLQYKLAMNADETSVPALAGIIQCQIIEGHTTEAEQQLEFLAEIQSSIGKQADLLFLNALLAQQKNAPSSEVIPILHETVDIHFSTVKGTPLSTKYFQLINPHFLLQIAKALMVYAPTEPVSTTTQVDPVLRRAAAVLDPLAKSMPGMLASLFQLAKIKFLSGETESAQLILQRITEKDSTSMESHLLMAKIQLHRGNIKQCSASLELALSSNFEVQNYPIYHLVKAQCERQEGNIEEALTSLQTAMSFITRSSAKSSRQTRAMSTLLPPLALSEQVTVYLELASVHTQLGHTHESTKIIQDTINEFTGTSEEFRITLTNAEFALERGDVEEALSQLRKIDEDNQFYLQAKEKMAEIYLTKRKDKKMYIACYENLAKKVPGPPTALLLGDAYMHIQEPERALEIYETALRRNARDSLLASKVGQALIKTHNYSKAVLYYETALKSDTQQFLRLDLAELFLKLRQFEKAEKTIKVALDLSSEEVELTQMVEKVKFMQLLSKVYIEAKQMDKAVVVLTSASELQSKVLTRVTIEQPDSAQAQKTTAASIFFEMAKACQQLEDNSRAITYYCEALKKKHDFLEARLALARLYLAQGDVNSCDQECIILLRIDQDNEQAALMRADLLFHRGYDMYQEAIHHLQELLGRKPAHFDALFRYVELARRIGELDKVQFYLDQAEKACARAAYEPGLNYCKGLYKRYHHEANDALHLFNQARKDTMWGEKALFAMIEICLNPENDMIAGEILKPIVDNTTHEDQIAVKTAEKLLLEVHPRSTASEQKMHVLECYILLNDQNKANSEKALEKLMVMASTNRNDVGLLMGIASAHMILKQVPRARNQLKIASKVPWMPENAQDFEQAWLLLADIFIQSGKYDVALDLLKKCVMYNKSCSKAWEYRGFISEKEHAYKDAASFYEQAWKYSYHANPTIGYKLAFNYLKAKWYVGAIDVCHQVLEKHPNYPKIKGEILDKARVSIRT